MIYGGYLAIRDGVCCSSHAVTHAVTAAHRIKSAGTIWPQCNRVHGALLMTPFLQATA